MSRSRSNYGSGTYEKLPSGKMRLRTMVEMPDGTKKRKTFTGKTQADCRKALKVYTDSLHEPAGHPYGGGYLHRRAKHSGHEQ